VKLPMVGSVGPSTASADVTKRAAFARRLGELGWVEGRNIAMEYRWAEGVIAWPARSRQKVDVIVISGDAQVLAAKRATSEIPRSSRRQWPGRKPRASGRRRHWPVASVDGFHRQAARHPARVIPGLRHLAILFNAANPLTAPELNAALAGADEMAE
jgi:putative ABC transport system substrate-binding protein